MSSFTLLYTTNYSIKGFLQSLQREKKKCLDTSDLKRPQLSKCGLIDTKPRYQCNPSQNMQYHHSKQNKLETSLTQDNRIMTQRVWIWTIVSSLFAHKEHLVQWIITLVQQSIFFFKHSWNICKIQVLVLKPKNTIRREWRSSILPHLILNTLWTRRHG